jgi:hypothetical protein
MKHKAKVSVLLMIMTLHSCAVEDELLAVKLAGFKDHNICFAEVECELALFTEAGQCIQLLLNSFWASGV